MKWAERQVAFSSTVRLFVTLLVMLALWFLISGQNLPVEKFSGTQVSSSAMTPVAYATPDNTHLP